MGHSDVGLAQSAEPGAKGSLIAGMATVQVNPDEAVFSAIRAQGAGGQNVNKVSNAVHLRFDIATSSLPDAIKERLRALSDQRVTADGVVVIKAQTSRSLDKNKTEALARLREMVDSVAVLPKARKPTKPTRTSQVKRVDGKVSRGSIKKTRAKVSDVG